MSTNVAFLSRQRPEIAAPGGIGRPSPLAEKPVTPPAPARCSLAADLVPAPTPETKKKLKAAVTRIARLKAQGAEVLYDLGTDPA